MAKEFPPPPPRDQDVPLRTEQLLTLSLLARLPQAIKDKLLRYPRYLWLRRCRKGEVICRQGQEDCTAFYILKGVDIHRVRAGLRQRQAEAPAELAALESAPPSEASDARRELRKLPGEIEFLEAVLKQIPPERQAILEAAYAADEELEKLRCQALARLDRLQKARSAAEQELKKHAKQADEKGDKVKVDLCKQLAKADAARKRAQAEQLAVGDAPLAQCLRELARAEEDLAHQGKTLQQAADFYRTADAARKRGRAEETGTEPRLAEWLRASARADDDPAPFATVHLAAAPATVKRLSWFERLKRTWRTSRAPSAEQAPLFIPFDGPRDIDYRSRQTSVDEGELFGEMACLDRRPRSATVVAQRDGYLLEMLSNILEEIDKDPDYQAQRRETYKKRIIDLHLRELPIFRELTDAQYGQIINEIRPNIELVSFASGQLICDEHDRSDCLYLVRDGLVQVKKNVSALLSDADILNWPVLTQSLRGAAGPIGVVAKLLPASARTLPGAAGDSGPLPETARAEIVYGLNDVIKDRKFGQAPELRAILDSSAFRDRAALLPANRADWSELEQRRWQRFLLEAILPAGTIRLLPRSAGPDLILTYCSRGEFIGEMGVMEHRPRMATCLAYSQPRQYADQKDLGRVELVRLPKDDFWKLMDTYPFLADQVAAEMARRKRQNLERLEQPANFEPVQSGLLSSEASRLGLIQGQQLMLIDLERCTRCDLCVQACAGAHEDGKSRLFLLGPRFDHYLVPMTCRSCLDPVCMIGCPVRSIQRGEHHEMVIKDWCIGCGKCAKQCPYDAIQMHALDSAAGASGENVVEVTERAVVCDLCQSLKKPEPRCVYVCPHEAALRVDARTDFPRE